MNKKEQMSELNWSHPSHNFGLAVADGAKNKKHQIQGHASPHLSFMLFVAVKLSWNSFIALMLAHELWDFTTLQSDVYIFDFMFLFCVLLRLFKAAHTGWTILQKILRCVGARRSWHLKGAHCWRRCDTVPAHHTLIHTGLSYCMMLQAEGLAQVIYLPCQT